MKENIAMPVRLILSSAAILMSSAAFSQELPGNDQLLSLISNNMPPYWTTSELEVVATTRGGNAARPEAIVRFEANAAPKQDLFRLTESAGPFALVVKTGEAGATRRLYGYQELAYAAGNWTGTVTIENPVAEFGQPLDLFTRPTLEVGTEDAAQRLAALNDAATTNAVAANQSALVKLGAEHQKAVSELQAANAKALSESSSAHEIALAEAEAKGRQRLEEARRGYDAEFAKITVDREPMIAEARAALEVLLADEQEKADAKLAAERKDAAAELERLRAEHAARRGELIEKQRQEMAELETALATERQSLQRQVETADETIALQQRLLASLNQRAAGADAVLAAFNKAREARLAFFGRLPKDWTGQVRCESVQPGVYSYTGPVSVRLEGSTSTTGRTGAINMTEDIRYADRGPGLSLALLDDGLTFPLGMRARINGRGSFPLDVFSVVDITISQDGRMQGAATRPVTVDQVSREVTCTFLLGAHGN